MITEKDLEKTLQDFETFCNFIEKKKPRLTPARSELGKKECFELDRLLSNPKNFEFPKYLQVSYPSINLWFHISLAAGFFGVEAGTGANIFFGTRYRCKGCHANQLGCCYDQCLYKKTS